MNPAQLTAAICKKSVWEVKDVEITEERGLRVVLEASSYQAHAYGGPSELLGRLYLPALDREARILDLEQEIQLLKAKLEGVLLANGVVNG